ncbi:MAG TPA: DUF5107 domain-containing protein, partial [Terracidiphilus sp.]|nr:DUF5107 domain-containing protein [Terracidiphilus sp.]
AARRDRDFVQMQVRPVSESTFWSGMALNRLGEAERALQTFQTVFDYSLQLEQETPQIDYFATSLPAMLLFDEDLALCQRILALFLRAQACFGLTKTMEAEVLLQKIEALDHNHFGLVELRSAVALSPL